ncbi:PREDICTED: proteasome subunit beta type-2-like [Rhagoletis zephyria]|uniref:proteasome subunit beta type-2-like n=1 Tax=Rhagoletis zephyria TaxID=28612 RepID=UPI0008114641|nr:PREDICTED: proteasome subunit beta type-2-like [Rhagoletis zephyria]
MECLIGIQFKDFVLLAADRISVHSILVVKHDVNKIKRLSDNLAMAVIGEPGDSIQFAEYISKNIQLYKMRNGYELSPLAAATYVQRNLANYLRSRTPYHVNMLVAGYDTQTNEPELHYLDYLATSHKVPFGMHGYGAMFATGIMDRIYKADSTLDEALEMLRKCVAEIQKRLVVSLPSFKVSIIDKNGIRDLQDIVVDPVNMGITAQSGSAPQAVPMVH